MADILDGITQGVQGKVGATPELDAAELPNLSDAIQSFRKPVKGALSATAGIGAALGSASLISGLMSGSLTMAGIASTVGSALVSAATWLGTAAATASPIGIGLVAGFAAWKGISYLSNGSQQAGGLMKQLFHQNVTHPLEMRHEAKSQIYQTKLHDALRKANFSQEEKDSLGELGDNLEEVRAFHQLKLTLLKSSQEALQDALEAKGIPLTNSLLPNVEQEVTDKIVTFMEDTFELIAQRVKLTNSHAGQAQIVSHAQRELQADLEQVL